VVSFGHLQGRSGRRRLIQVLRVDSLEMKVEGETADLLDISASLEDTRNGDIGR
jgi:hypothetical protein